MRHGRVAAVLLLVAAGHGAPAYDPNKLQVKALDQTPFVLALSGKGRYELRRPNGSVLIPADTQEIGPLNAQTAVLCRNGTCVLWDLLRRRATRELPFTDVRPLFTRMPEGFVGNGLLVYGPSGKASPSGGALWSYARLNPDGSERWRIEDVLNLEYKEVYGKDRYQVSKPDGTQVVFPCDVGPGLAHRAEDLRPGLDIQGLPPGVLEWKVSLQGGWYHRWKTPDGPRWSRASADRRKPLPPQADWVDVASYEYDTARKCTVELHQTPAGLWIVDRMKVGEDVHVVRGHQGRTREEAHAGLLDELDKEDAERRRRVEAERQVVTAAACASLDQTATSYPDRLAVTRCFRSLGGDSWVAYAAGRPDLTPDEYAEAAGQAPAGSVLQASLKAQQRARARWSNRNCIEVYRKAGKVGPARECARELGGRDWYQWLITDEYLGVAEKEAELVKARADPEARDLVDALARSIQDKKDRMASIERKRIEDDARAERRKLNSLPWVIQRTREAESLWCQQNPLACKYTPGTSSMTPDQARQRREFISDYVAGKN